MKINMAAASDNSCRLSPVTCHWLLWPARFCFAAMDSRAQSNVVGHASDFTSVEYYPAPNQQQMKSRLSGAEAQPLPGGLLVIKQLKLETFEHERQAGSRRQGAGMRL